MKRLLLFSIFIISVSVFSEEIPTSVTLKDAIRSALSKTETVPIGEARINQADSKIDQARASFFPSLSFGANYQEQRNTSTILQNTGIFGGTNQSYTRFNISQSIYEGQRDISKLRASKFGKEVQRSNLSSEGYAVFTKVANGFFAILSGQTEVENLKKTIAIAQVRIKEIQKRVKIGKSRNFEVTASEAQLAVLQAQYMAAEGQLVTSWDQFVLNTGLSRNIILIEKRDKPNAPDKLEAYLSYVEKRPDIEALKAQVESDKNNIDVARAGHFPSIGLSGNYYPTSSVGNTKQNSDWDAGVTLTFPLYSGGMVSAQVSEASFKKSETELLLAQAKRQAEIEIRTAYNNLTSAINQIKALESALSSTEQNYKEQEKNYRFGQATNLDVVQALYTFQDTKRSLDRMRYQALYSWAELKAAAAQVPFANLITGEGEL